MSDVEFLKTTGITVGLIFLVVVTVGEFSPRAKHVGYNSTVLCKRYQSIWAVRIAAGTRICNGRRLWMSILMSSWIQQGSSTTRRVAAQPCRRTCWQRYPATSYTGAGHGTTVIPVNLESESCPSEPARESNGAQESNEGQEV